MDGAYKENKAYKYSETYLLYMTEEKKKKIKTKKHFTMCVDLLENFMIIQRYTVP